jgi:hypothetical protein
VYKTPFFVLVRQFQEVTFWGADNLGLGREKDAKGTSSIRIRIISESMKYASPKYIGQ